MNQIERKERRPGHKGRVIRITHYSSGHAVSSCLYGAEWYESDDAIADEMKIWIAEETQFMDPVLDGQDHVFLAQFDQAVVEYVA